MSLGTSNRDGGRTSESGHLRAIQKGFAGEVLSGLAVAQHAAGANMSVDIGIGDAIIPRADGTYGHMAFNDAVLNSADTVITTADPSNPRRDMVVMYIDYDTTPSTGVSNNTNGVVKVKVIAGTPAGSPSDPTDAAIQSAVGASNPYIKLARVRVGAGVTSIGTSVIDDLRMMAQAQNNGGWEPQASAADSWAYNAWDSTNKVATIDVPSTTGIDVYKKVRYWQLTGGWKYGEVIQIVSSTRIKVYHDTATLNNERIYLPAIAGGYQPKGYTRQNFHTPFIFDHIISGVLITGDSLGSNKNYSISAGWVWLNGRRLWFAGVSAQTVGASKDRYIDFSDAGDGSVAVTNTEVSNNAASPSLAAGSIRIGIVVAGATTIADAGSINQGQYNKLLPIASFIPYAVTDSLGNKICNRDPNMRLLGYRRQISSNINTASTSNVQMGLMSSPVIVPANRELYVHLWVPTVYNSNDNQQAIINTWDGTVGSGARLNEELGLYGASARAAQGQSCDALYDTTSGLHTFNGGLRTGGAGSIQVDWNNGHGFIAVELR